MKKTISIILVILIMLSVSAEAFAADKTVQKKLNLPKEDTYFQDVVVSDSGMVAALVSVESWGQETDAIAYSKDNINYSLLMLSDYATSYDYDAYLVCRGDEFLIAVYSKKEINKNGSLSGVEVSTKLLSTKDFKTFKEIDCPKKSSYDLPYMFGAGMVKMNNGDVILSLPGYIKTKTEKYSEEYNNIYGYGIYYVIDKTGKWTECHSPEALMHGIADGAVSDFFVNYLTKGDLLETDITLLRMGGDFEYRPYEGFFTADYKNYVKFTLDDEADGIDLLASDKNSSSAYVFSRSYMFTGEEHTIKHALSAIDKKTGKAKSVISYTYDAEELTPSWYYLNDCDGYNYCFMKDKNFTSIVNRIDMKTGDVKTFKVDADSDDIEYAVYSNGFIVLNMCDWVADKDSPNLSVKVISVKDFKVVNEYVVPYYLSSMYINGNKAYRINSNESTVNIITLPFDEPEKLDGLIKTDAGWKYFKDNQIDYSFIGLAKNDYGWWYINNGTIDYKYEGLAANQYGLWYVKNGKIDFNCNKVTRYQGEWYYVVNGQVSTKTSGLIKCELGWMYFKNGKVDMGFEGLAKNQYGWWYILNGTINYRYKGLAKNQYGWWYVSDGTINYKYQGLAKNQYGWWYVSNGKIDYDFRGLAKNDYGWWYVKNGKIDFTYNGTARNPYGRWNVVNGKVTTKAA